MAERWQLFRDRGRSALPRIIEISERLAEIRKAMDSGFPLDEPEAQELREQIADRIQVVHDIESDAVDQLRSIMGERACLPSATWRELAIGASPLVLSRKSANSWV